MSPASAFFFQLWVPYDQADGRLAHNSTWGPIIQAALARALTNKNDQSCRFRILPVLINGSGYPRKPCHTKMFILLLFNLLFIDYTYLYAFFPSITSSICGFTMQIEMARCEICWVCMLCPAATKRIAMEDVQVGWSRGRTK